MKLTAYIEKGVSKFLKEFEGEYGFLDYGKYPTTAAVIVHTDGCLLVENTACNAGIRTKTPNKARCIIHGLTYMLDGYDRDVDLCNYFIDYILYRSPWSFVFFEKEYGLKNKCVLVRTDVPTSMSFGAMRVLRQAWENKHVVRLFHALSKAGVNENLALLVAFSCPGNGLSWRVGHNLSHTMASTNFLKEDVALFLQGKYNLNISRTFNKCGTYENVDSAFNADNRDVYGVSFTEYLHQLAKEVGAKTTGNLFKVVVVKDNGATMDTVILVDFIVKNQSNIIKWVYGE